MNSLSTSKVTEITRPFAMPVMAAKIRKLREMYGCSQEYVAYLMNISQASYSKKESGRTDISLNCLIKIADIYYITLNDLLFKSLKELLLMVIQSDEKWKS